MTGPPSKLSVPMSNDDCVNELTKTLMLMAKVVGKPIDEAKTDLEKACESCKQTTELCEKEIRSKILTVLKQARTNTEEILTNTSAAGQEIMVEVQQFLKTAEKEFREKIKDITDRECSTIPQHKSGQLSRNNYSIDVESVNIKDKTFSNIKNHPEQIIDSSYELCDAMAAKEFAKAFKEYKDLAEHFCNGAKKKMQHILMINAIGATDISKIILKGDLETKNRHLKPFRYSKNMNAPSLDNTDYEVKSISAPNTFVTSIDNPLCRILSAMFDTFESARCHSADFIAHMQNIFKFLSSDTNAVLERFRESQQEKVITPEDGKSHDIFSDIENIEFSRIPLQCAKTTSEVIMDFKFGLFDTIVRTMFQAKEKIYDNNDKGTETALRARNAVDVVETFLQIAVTSFE